MIINNPAEYKSRDIYLSTAIKTCGIPLIRVENHKGKGFFVFEYSPKIEDIISQYHNGILKLDARTLFGVWKDLKSLAFSAVDSYQNGDIRYANSNHNQA